MALSTSICGCAAAGGCATALEQWSCGAETTAGITSRGLGGTIKRSLAVALGILVSALGACRKEETKPAEPPAISKPESRPVAQLVFSDSLRCDDASVNEFVTKAMNTCASKNYEDFRLLWSAREDPMSRDEFEESWNAVKDIRIRALEKAKLAGMPVGDVEAPKGNGNPTTAIVGPPNPGVNKPSADKDEKSAVSSEPQLVYVIVAEVTLDPAHRAAERKPQREVALMLVREHGQWRLAKAPKPMREWLRKKLEAPAAAPTNPVSPPIAPAKP